MFLTFKYVFGIELKKDGVTRIITIGDSITNGFNLDPSQSYPAQLMKILNDPTKYEVINLGVDG